MKSKSPLIVLFVIATAFMLICYGKVMLKPNAYLFANYGDGIKNYYTYYYHIKHSKDALEFDGMNYPYGEHYLYTDCHPVLTHAFRTASKFWPGVVDYSIGFLNFIMIASIFFTFFLVFWLLKAFKINEWLAVIFAFAITVAQPQLFRLVGHFALSYSIAIPLSWFLIIRCESSASKWKYQLILLLVNIFWMFIHAYLGVIVIFFQASFYFVSFVKNTSSRWKYSFFLGLSAIPVLVFKVFTSITDHHVGRTNDPWGFFYYNAELDDLFLPHHPPLRPIMDAILPFDIYQKEEGWAYIGLAFTLVLVFFVYQVVKSRFGKSVNYLIEDLRKQSILNTSLSASVLVLLFAFCFPFKQFPILAEWLPIVKQFRATGRFAWVFYYTSCVFSVYIIQHLFNHLKQKGRRNIALVIIIATAGMTIWEGLAYHQEIAKRITESMNLFNKKQLDGEYKALIELIDPDKYQAIIPMPFYYYGSEKYSRPRQDDVTQTSMVFSANTGLPIMASSLTRVSVQESKNIVQLMSPNYYKKEIESDIVDERPFLIVQTRRQLTPYESEIVSHAKHIDSGDYITILELPKEALFQSTYAEEVNGFQDKRHQLIPYQSFLLDISNEDSIPETNLILSKEGAYALPRMGKQLIHQFEPNLFQVGKKYVVSLWMNNEGEEALSGLKLFVRERIATEGKWNPNFVICETAEVINGDWSLIEVEFEIANSTNQVNIELEGPKKSEEELRWKDLLVYRKGSTIYQIVDQESFVFKKNNHWIEHY